VDHQKEAVEIDMLFAKIENVIYEIKHIGDDCNTKEKVNENENERVDPSANNL